MGTELETFFFFLIISEIRFSEYCILLQQVTFVPHECAVDAPLHKKGGETFGENCEEF